MAIVAHGNIVTTLARLIMRLPSWLGFHEKIQLKCVTRRILLTDIARNSWQIKQPKHSMRHPTIWPKTKWNFEKVSMHMKAEESMALKMFTNSILKKKRAVRTLFCFARRLLKYADHFSRKKKFNASLSHKFCITLIWSIPARLSSLIRFWGIFLWHTVRSLTLIRLGSIKKDLEI